MPRRTIFFLLLLITGVAGYVAGASVVISSPAYGDTSKQYSLGYSVSISVNNGTSTTIANVTAGLGSGPRVGGVSASQSLAYQGLANNYEFNGSATGNSTLIIIPPPATRTVTNTTTVTKTYTYTVTKTITGPNGETTVITQIRTVTIPQEKHYDKRVLYGLGVLALLFLLILARR